MPGELELAFPCWACLSADSLAAAVDATAAKFFTVSQGGETYMAIWQSENDAKIWLLSSSVPPLLVRFENPEMLAASLEKSAAPAVMIVLSREVGIRFLKGTFLDMLRKSPEPLSGASRIEMRAKPSPQIKRVGDDLVLPLPCYAALHNVSKELISQGLPAEECVWVTVTLDSEECFAIWASDYDAKAFLSRLGPKPAILKIPDAASLLAYLERVPFTRLAVNPHFDTGTPYQFEVASVIKNLRGQ